MGFDRYLPEIGLNLALVRGSRRMRWNGQPLILAQVCLPFLQKKRRRLRRRFLRRTAPRMALLARTLHALLVALPSHALRHLQGLACAGASTAGTAAGACSSRDLRSFGPFNACSQTVRTSRGLVLVLTVEHYCAQDQGCGQARNSARHAGTQRARLPPRFFFPASLEFSARTGNQVCAAGCTGQKQQVLRGQTQLRAAGSARRRGCLDQAVVISVSGTCALCRPRCHVCLLFVCWARAGTQVIGLVYDEVAATLEYWLDGKYQGQVFWNLPPGCFDAR